MTKAKASSALKNVIETNPININITEWVERASMKQASMEQANTGVQPF